jgi:hypothetical protein
MLKDLLCEIETDNMDDKFDKSIQIHLFNYLWYKYDAQNSEVPFLGIHFDVMSIPICLFQQF